MPVKKSDYIEHGYLTTYGADGEPIDRTHLNPQQLATDESRDKVIEYCEENVPEGSKWAYVDLHAEMTNNNNKYNCPCWMAVAANGQRFNCGELFHNLFDYANPTPAVIDELHRLAGAPATA